MIDNFEKRRSRRADKDELLDFFMSLISDSSNAMETILVGVEEQPFWVEEYYEESGKEFLAK